MSNILRSLAITCVVSATLAYFLTTFNIEFLKTFLLAIILQVAGWNIFQYVIKTRVAQKRRDQDNVMLAEIAKQSAVIPCAYCAQENLVPIRLDEDNNFECSECNKENSVYVNIQTVQVTVPLDTQDK